MNTYLTCFILFAGRLFFLANGSLLIKKMTAPGNWQKALWKKRICTVYTYAVVHGLKGISFLAKLCIYLFFGLLIIVLLIGGQGRFIIENSVQSLGKMFQKIQRSTWEKRASFER